METRTIGIYNFTAIPDPEIISNVGLKTPVIAKLNGEMKNRPIY